MSTYFTGVRAASHRRRWAGLGDLRPCARPLDHDSLEPASVADLHTFAPDHDGTTTLETVEGRREALGTGVKLIEPPMTAKVFPMVMMMGMMVLMIAVVVGIIDGFLTYDYWNHSVATELNPAAAGSSLLSDLGTISTIKLWLEPLKFVGIAMLLSGIGLALATIVPVLRWQASRLWEVLS